jgi:thiol:disulfide interchange protein DsbD
LLGVLGHVVGVGAQETASDPSPHSEIGLVSEVASIQPGQAFTVAIRITLDPEWHTYWINAGDAGLPLAVRWDLPDGFVAAALEWPVPQRIPVPPFMSYGYEDELLVLARITPPATLARTQRVTLRGDVDWLVCANVCIPAQGEVTLTLPVTTGLAEADSRWGRAIDAVRERLPQALDGWRARAWEVDSAYILDVVPVVGAPLSAPYLCSDSTGIVEHAFPQRVVRVGESWRIRIPKSEFAPDDVSRIGGVLVGDAGKDRDSPGWTIEAQIGAVPADVASESSDAFLAALVLETGGIAEDKEPSAVPASAGMSIILALAFAFAGGMILNLMPCVFPVLSVKVMSFVDNAGANGAMARRHGAMFAAGVVLSFWVLAGSLFALRAAGAQLGWGFHLQSPTIVALLALGMFALALSMSGVFEVGVMLTRLGQARSSRGDIDALLTGGLAVLVAAPCTAPFMGAALGYALVQPPLAGLAVFTTLALGLAAPYTVLSWTPGMMSRLPRPGRWMETLKQLLAFPLYATVVWLVWVFGRQTGLNASAILLLALTATGLAAWIAGRTSGARTAAVRVGIGSVALLAVALSTWGARAVAATPLREISSSSANTDGAAWEPFSPERVAALRRDGQIVFVNFTAAWCLSCQVNDRVALRAASVRRAFSDSDVALLEADWTSRDAVIADVLQSFGRSGVPLYVVHPPSGSAPEVLSAILTPRIVIDAIARAHATRTAGS